MHADQDFLKLYLFYVAIAPTPEIISLPGGKTVFDQSVIKLLWARGDSNLQTDSNLTHMLLSVPGV